MASQESPATEKPKGGTAKRVLFTLAVVVLAFAGYQGWQWYSVGRFHEKTDDAYLQADMVMLQAKDTGYISDILVGPNAPVTRDQIIARIDPADYQLALEKAQNALALADSALVQIDAQITAGLAAVAQADAAIAAASATNDGAQKTYRRAQDLRATTAGTQAALDQAEAMAKSTKAQVKSAQAARAQAQAELTVLNARRDSAKLDVRAGQTSVKLAERDLTFTEIRAPFDGILTERQIEIGSFVTTGSRIGTMVPVADIYVEANFKETQIADIRPGAKATIRVDAWPDAVLRGTVESLTAGTGQVFSLLPASNATGNFTKVVQRVPVRITLDPADRARLPLRPGMSVVAEIDLRTGSDAPAPALAPLPAPADDAPLTSQRDSGQAATAPHSEG